MSEHTPGPWGVFGKGVSVAKTEWTFGPQICRQPISRSAARNWEANARLIAAAPELLAALKNVVRSFRKDFRHEADPEGAFRKAYADELALIAKAEGRE